MRPSLLFLLLLGGVAVAIGASGLSAAYINPSIIERAAFGPFWTGAFLAALTSIGLLLVIYTAIENE